jgi:hypothetical protein
MVILNTAKNLLLADAFVILNAVKNLFLAVKVVDIFGNDTMTIVEVAI